MRLVLRTVSALVAALILWSVFGKLDIVSGAEGKLVPQTLLKVVQPAEAGVVAELLVHEGDKVIAGQVLVRLDPTLARAEQGGVADEMKRQALQIRRIESEMHGKAFVASPGDDMTRFLQAEAQLAARRTSFARSIEHEQALLARAQNEVASARAVLTKLEETLPSYRKVAAAYDNLEREGFLGGLAAAEKQRESLEKAKDLDAQRATVASLLSGVTAQRTRILHIESAHRAELGREIADLRASIAQLQPNLDRANYKHTLMELKASQDGVVKDIATTTVGAVVQPGVVILTLIPKDERLFADVQIKNEDAGFVRVGQVARIKFAAFPFQKYGMATGKVIHISADASEPNVNGNIDESPQQVESYYKARVQLDSQALRSPQGTVLPLSPGMQLKAEITQGQRTVIEYLLSPLQKALSEAGRER